MPLRTTENTMISSKRNKFCLLLLAPCFLGCTTSPFRISKVQDNAVEILTSPDRILVECEHLDRDDGEIADGFMLHLLSDENSVITVSEGSSIDPESCANRIKYIGQLLANDQKIYVAGFGNLRNTREDMSRSFTFQIGRAHV